MSLLEVDAVIASSYSFISEPLKYRPFFAQRRGISKPAAGHFELALSQAIFLRFHRKGSARQNPHEVNCNKDLMIIALSRAQEEPSFLTIAGRLPQADCHTRNNEETFEQVASRWYCRCPP